MGRKYMFEFGYMVMMAAAGQNKITLDQRRIKQQHSRLIAVWAGR